jgi:uncharacterized membrane protein
VWVSSFTSFGSVGDVVDPLFAFHCHRDPSRTLELFGRRLPICARCTGIYAGMIAGAAVPPPPWSKGALSWAVVVAAALIGLDVLTEFLAWQVPSLAVRFVTGLAFSATVVLAALTPRHGLEHGLH